jgi:hypothetical protein
MQTADHIGAFRAGVIFLHEMNSDPVTGKNVFPKDLGKETSRVAMA